MNNPLTLILLALLSLSVWFNYKHTETIETLNHDYIELKTVKVSLDDQVSALKKDIKEMPTRYIETTREVDKEICLGVNAIDKVMSLHNRTEQVITEGNKSNAKTTNEKVKYVDIDGELPPDLVRLLNED